VLAGFVALLPVVLSVWGEWLKAHPGASGGLTFGLLAALAAALGIGPTQGRATTAAVATTQGQPTPGPS
jgi:hypothetical protein